MGSDRVVTPLTPCLPGRYAVGATPPGAAGPPRSHTIEDADPGDRFSVFFFWGGGEWEGLALCWAGVKISSEKSGATLFNLFTLISSHFLSV